MTIINYPEYLVPVATIAGDQKFNQHKGQRGLADLENNGKELNQFGILGELIALHFAYQNGYGYQWNQANKNTWDVKIDNWFFNVKAIRLHQNNMIVNKKAFAGCLDVTHYMFVKLLPDNEAGIITVKKSIIETWPVKEGQSGRPYYCKNITEWQKEENRPVTKATNTNGRSLSS